MEDLAQSRIFQRGRLVRESLCLQLRIIVLPALHIFFSFSKAPIFHFTRAASRPRKFRLSGADPPIEIHGGFEREVGGSPAGIGEVEIGSRAALP